ncbi:MAG: hypothetical protein ACKO0M_11060 [Cyanobium sp.]
MRAVMIATAVACLIPTAGCSEFKRGFEEGLNQGNYTEAMKTKFIDACNAEAIKNVTPEQARKYCDCTYDRVSSTVPVAEFVKFDTGETISDAARTSLRVAVAQCGGNANQL